MKSRTECPTKPLRNAYAVVAVDLTPGRSVAAIDSRRTANRSVGMNTQPECPARPLRSGCAVAAHDRAWPAVGRLRCRPSTLRAATLSNCALVHLRRWYGVPREETKVAQQASHRYRRRLPRLSLRKPWQVTLHLPILPNMAHCASGHARSVTALPTAAPGNRS